MLIYKLIRLFKVRNLNLKCKWILMEESSTGNVFDSSRMFSYGSDDGILFRIKAFFEGINYMNFCNLNINKSYF